jgi:hypothetical protein
VALKSTWEHQQKLVVEIDGVVTTSEASWSVRDTSGKIILFENAAGTAGNLSYYLSFNDL